jgi:hypothetical protein
MTVPTITRLSPTLGHTGGRTLVEIEGSGFALPSEPPAEEIPVPDPVPSVAVMFGGVPALDVAVESDTIVFALTPICPLPMTSGPGSNDLPFPATVDVVVQNLDVNGDPMPGEVVTAAAAYEYRRPDLSQENHATTTVRALIEELRRQILPVVDYAVHTDYADNGATEINLAYLATMPALVILNLRFPDAAVGRRQGVQAAKMTLEGVFARRREPVTVDAVMELLGVADNDTELQGLMVATRLFFQKNPTLSVPRNPLGPSAGTIAYTLDFQFGDPMTLTVSGSGANSNLLTFSLGCAIRGIVLEEMPGLPEQGIVGTPAGLAHEATRAVTEVADEIDLEREKVS